MPRIAALLASVAGCGFHPAAMSDGGPDPIDAPIDGTIDGPSKPCHDQWLDGTIRFHPPTRLAELSTSAADRDPYVRPDGLTIYFSSNRADLVTFTYDVYIATRATVAVPFGAPVKFGPASTSASDGKMSMTDDGSQFVVSNDALVDPDLYQSNRAGMGTYMPLDIAPFTNIDDTNAQQDPWISSDGDRVYFALNTGSVQHIVFASRTAPDQTFGSGTIPASLDSNLGDADPALSSDERVIVFSSNRPLAGFAGGNLWYATRPSASGAFGMAHAIPDLNTSSNDGDPVMSADGCSVYFASDATGNYDIYVASVR